MDFFLSFSRLNFKITRTQISSIFRQSFLVLLLIIKDYMCIAKTSSCILIFGQFNWGDAIWSKKVTKVFFLAGVRYATYKNLKLQFGSLFISFFAHQQCLLIYNKKWDYNWFLSLSQNKISYPYFIVYRPKLCYNFIICLIFNEKRFKSCIGYTHQNQNELFYRGGQC